MKTNLILVVLFFHFANILAQPIDSLRPNLFVEKGKKILQFKANKLLHIRKSNGSDYWGKEYSLLDESILFHSRSTLKTDTILLRDIKWIKGRTHGNEGRIIGGALMAVGGPAIGFFPVFAVAFGGGPAGLVAVPFAIMSVEGITLLSPRKFNVEDKWKLTILKL